MSMTVTEPDELGLLTLAELAERTGVPKRTLISWSRAGHLCVLRLDGVYRSTVTEVHRAAESVRRGKARKWELEPLADHDERVAV